MAGTPMSSTEARYDATRSAGPAARPSPISNPLRDIGPPWSSDELTAFFNAVLRLGDNPHAVADEISTKLTALALSAPRVATRSSVARELAQRRTPEMVRALYKIHGKFLAGVLTSALSSPQLFVTLHDAVVQTLQMVWRPEPEPLPPPAEGTSTPRKRPATSESPGRGRKRRSNGVGSPPRTPSPQRPRQQQQQQQEQQQQQLQRYGCFWTDSTPTVQQILDQAASPLVQLSRREAAADARTRLMLMLSDKRRAQPQPQQNPPSRSRCNVRSGGALRWCAYEFFYSDLDRPFFFEKDTFSQRVREACGLVVDGMKLTRAEWAGLRRQTGLTMSGRAMSQRGLKAERRKLVEFRDQARAQRGAPPASVGDQVDVMFAGGVVRATVSALTRNGTYLSVFAPAVGGGDQQRAFCALDHNVRVVSQQRAPHVAAALAAAAVAAIPSGGVQDSGEDTVHALARSLKLLDMKRVLLEELGHLHADAYAMMSRHEVPTDLFRDLYSEVVSRIDEVNHSFLGCMQQLRGLVSTTTVRRGIAPKLAVPATPVTPPRQIAVSALTAPAPIQQLEPPVPSALPAIPAPAVAPLPVHRLPKSLFPTSEFAVPGAMVTPPPPIATPVSPAPQQHAHLAAIVRESASALVAQMGNSPPNSLLTDRAMAVISTCVAVTQALASVSDADSPSPPSHPTPKTAPEVLEFTRSLLREHQTEIQTLNPAVMQEVDTALKRLIEMCFSGR